MTSQTLTPDAATSPTRTKGGARTSLHQALRARRTSSDRAARRAAAREIASYPATRSASAAVLPGASRQAR
jgi:hypothetical protein